MPDHSSADAWNGYRRRFRLFICVWLGGFVFVAALMHVLSLVAGPGWPGMVIGVFWLLAFAIAGIRLQSLACPRCQNPFFSSPWYYWPFARKCVHCGLPKWQ